MLRKILLLMTLAILLSGCSAYDSSFEKKQKCYQYLKPLVEDDQYTYYEFYQGSPPSYASSKVSEIFYSPKLDTCIASIEVHTISNSTYHYFLDVLTNKIVEDREFYEIMTGNYQPQQKQDYDKLYDELKGKQ